MIIYTMLVTIYNFTRSYRVKVSTPQASRGRLLGSYGLIELVGEDMASKLLARAERSREYHTRMRLRRGLIFDWYSK